ncbi:MAG: phosphoribosyltransferase family protein [Bacteroidetes bacterium]|jgi:pyrimidine operon attenuation protein/uracil phosphoribosyltransferase|nr:phosphoribosyltransferase family protein [Bacteroidota bacterium]MDF1867200.1 phosphoribosyltransferase family protein [Saprospiraceae bacterium]
MQILTHRQIVQKIKRLAIEILEHNHKEHEIILAGINNNGMGFAQMLMSALVELTDKKITLTRIQLNPAKPLSEEIVLEMPIEEVKDNVIIIVDDVANTGRTIFYAFKPLMDILPKKVEVAVLVDRTHKSFPVKVDYFGLSLATTLKENIAVKIREVEEFGVFMN